MKLPKGPLKVITFCDEQTLVENELRARAGGKIFHPTVRLAVQGEGGAISGLIEGFGVRGVKGDIKSTINTVLHPWAAKNRTRVRYWIETTEAVEVITSAEDIQ